MAHSDVLCFSLSFTDADDSSGRSLFSRNLLMVTSGVMLSCCLLMLSWPKPKVSFLVLVMSEAPVDGSLGSAKCGAAVKEFASVVDSSKVEPLHRLESAKRLTDGESA